MLPVVRTSPQVVEPIRLHTLAQHNFSMLIAQMASISPYRSHGCEVQGSVDS
jgi:hypothetical protein